MFMNHNKACLDLAYVNSATDLIDLWFVVCCFNIYIVLTQHTEPQLGNDILAWCTVQNKPLRLIYVTETQNIGELN